MAHETGVGNGPTIQDLEKGDYNQIWEWNKTVPAVISNLVHKLIHDNVEVNPGAPAVCSWDGNLTYAELNDLSSRLADELKSRGTIVAILATVRVGGAFVLLDAKQPGARLRDIVSLTKAKFVVASPAQQVLATNISSQVLLVSHNILLTMPAITSTVLTVDPESTLLVVFTSGSTGLQGVDVSTDIILSTLIIGGCVCVPSELERQNDIAGAINLLKVNSADLTPSVARLLDPDSMPGLKVLKVGGELSELSGVTVVARWAPKLKLVNVYGPSECLLVATNVLALNGDPRTIGRGHGAVTWVVEPDDHNKLVPVGTNEPHLSLSMPRTGFDRCRARTDPPASCDLVHYNPGGALNFVGRKDTQVKVRGQRLELSEVEHHIQQQLYSRTGKRVNPIVELVTTGASKGSGGRPTLVGFLAMSQIESAEPEDAQQLRQAMWDLTKDLNKSLLKTLPQYMVPSVYIPLWQFPLHSSGKTDRRQLQVTGLVLPRQDLAALRAPPTTAKATTTALQSRTPPDTFVEQRMQRMWSKEGTWDSLSAIQLATLAAHEKLALTVQDTVQDIFDNPALARTTAV
ncbi:Nonribosomal peptide synthetases (NRPS) [Penicillium rubens]|nr:Nonribosomal peptide synthetases (NRPS) [Penicillium rubens]